MWFTQLTSSLNRSAWTEPGCKNANNDPNAKNGGDAYKKALPGWCQTKKAGCIFFWLSTSEPATHETSWKTAECLMFNELYSTLVFWIASFVLVVLDWREGRPVLGAGLRTTSSGLGPNPKPRDPPFLRPAHDDAESIISRDPSRRRNRERDDDDDDDEVQSPFADPRGGYSTSGGGQGRASMDMYGAFSDPAPSGYAAGRQQSQPPTSSYYEEGTTTIPPPPRFQPTSSTQQQSTSPGMSRTMAMAYEDTGTSSASYDDPYDRVRATLASPRPQEGAPPSYQYRLS